MRKILVVLMMLSSTTFAAFPILDFQNINGDFHDNRGNAYAEKAKYDLQNVKISHKQIEVKFNKIQKNLVLKDANTTVELGFDFSFLNIFKAFTFSGVDVTSTARRFDLFLESLNLYIDKSVYSVEDIDLRADVTNLVNSDADIDIIDGFMLNGDLNIGVMRFGDINSDLWLSSLMEENPSEKDFIQKNLNVLKKIPLIVRNLRMVVRKETFSGSCKLDSWINFNLYLGGTMKHFAKENKVVINLLKAKLGYLSMRKVILKALGLLKLQGVSINGSEITIDFGKSGRNFFK
jgi:hypothetical protein